MHVTRNASQGCDFSRGYKKKVMIKVVYFINRKDSYEHLKFFIGSLGVGLRLSYKENLILTSNQKNE